MAAPSTFFSYVTFQLLLVYQPKVLKGINDGLLFIFGALAGVPLAISLLSIRLMNLDSKLRSDLCQIESMNIKSVFFFDTLLKNGVCRRNCCCSSKNLCIYGNLDSTRQVFAP